MCRKIGIMAIVLMLGASFAGELMVLSAQKTEQTSDAQTEPVQKALPGQGTEQTTNTQTERAQNKLPAKTTPNSAGGENNSQIDTTKQNNSTSRRINYLNICLSLGGIGGFLYGLAAFLKFIWKARSKVPPELTTIEVVSKPENASIEVVSRPENASEVAEYIKAIERNPKATLVEKAIAEAFVLQRSEKIEKAIEKWRSIANIAEGHDKALAFRAWASVGFLYINEGIGKEALAALDKALNLKPDSAEIYNGRGAAKLMLKNYHNALADCDEAIRLKPDYAEAYNTRAVVKQDLERYQDALVDCDEAIRLKPDFTRAYNTRGTVKLLLKNYQDAIADFD
ncbi:MAG: hypothetical protein OXI24_11465, partial [Candidatus Poribacteria bacterium]|nr:hypothetical protein [Candidatus Poribacteria bacterium]